MEIIIILFIFAVFICLHEAFKAFKAIKIPTNEYKNSPKEARAHAWASIFLSIIFCMITIALIKNYDPSAQEQKPGIDFQACVDVTKKILQYPSSAEFNISTGSKYKILEDGSMIVLIDFTALNGFGNHLPQRAMCVYSINGEIIVNQIEKR